MDSLDLDNMGSTLDMLGSYLNSSGIFNEDTLSEEDLTDFGDDSAWPREEDAKEADEFSNVQDLFASNFLGNMDFAGQPDNFLSFDQEDFDKSRNASAPAPVIHSCDTNNQLSTKTKSAKTTKAKDSRPKQQRQMQPMPQMQMRPVPMMQHMRPMHPMPHMMQMQMHHHMQHDMIYPVQATQQQMAMKPKRKYNKRKSTDADQGAPAKKSMVKHNTDGVVSYNPKQLQKTNSAPSDGERVKQTSSFRGVSCCGKDRKWQARIRDANRVRYLGRFSTEVEAALVYDESARTLKGDRAPTNFVKLDQQGKDNLMAAFMANGNAVPDHLLHLVVRAKAKEVQKFVNSMPRAISTSFDFPDSPTAKVKSTFQSTISPSSMKSTAQKKTVQVHNRLSLDKGFDKALSAHHTTSGALQF